MYLHTTTWKDRNADMLAQVFDVAKTSIGPHPIIVSVGPGAGSAPWMYLHPGGKTRLWSRRQRFWGTIARLGDTVGRALPIGPLSSPELKEIFLLAKDLRPVRIHVVDIEFRVLAAARRVARMVGDERLFMYHRVDVATQPLPVTADIVIAYQVVERTTNPTAALQTIAAAVRPGGLLSVMTTQSVEGFEKLEPFLWRRAAAPAVAADRH